MTETFYDLLGVTDDATAEEIESAYREAIKRVHPDVSDDVDAGERTKRLNEAKRVLTDEDERARYDRLGHETYTNGGPGGSSASGSERRDSTGRNRRSESAGDSESGGRGASGADSAGRRSESTAGRRRWRSGKTDRSAEESTWRVRWRPRASDRRRGNRVSGERYSGRR